MKSKTFVWLTLCCLLLVALACKMPFGGDEVADATIPPIEVELVTEAVEIVVEPTPKPLEGFVITTDEPDVEEEIITEEVVVVPTTPSMGVGTTDINPVDSAILVYVPEGEFLMGNSRISANDDERPEHTVFLDAFWLYQTEVTNAQYRLCIQDGSCDSNINRYGNDDLPAVNVDWFEATDYCEWAGGRLPTEAEWEKGARGTDGRLFPWGDTFPDCKLANFKNCYDSKEISVGRLPAGASYYGALNMVGNVWEWVNDWYEEDYYSKSPISNPMGPDYTEEPFRVQRGGSFESEASFLTVTLRARSGPDKYDYRKGFRCIIPALP